MSGISTTLPHGKIQKLNKRRLVAYRENLYITKLATNNKNMKAQYNEQPAMIQKLDDKSYAFNYNIEKIQNEDSTAYVCDQVIINEDNINGDSIIREVLLKNWDVNQQFKLVNDYFAYQLGLTEDEKYKTRYEEFLEFRSKLKANVIKSII